MSGSRHSVRTALKQERCQLSPHGNFPQTPFSSQLKPRLRVSGTPGFTVSGQCCGRIAPSRRRFARPQPYARLPLEAPRQGRSYLHAQEEGEGEREIRPLERGGTGELVVMGLIFRWYLGLSSRWAVTGEAGREKDYQIWCGPSMGAFNAWVRNSYLEKASERTVVDVARQILSGAAYAYRVRHLESQGVQFPTSCCDYDPQPMRS
jgi:hypothetical protein